MRFLPLQLEAHFFTKVEVEANQSFQPEAEEKAESGIQTEVQVAQHQDNPRRWQVTLEVTLGTNDKEVPYKISLKCVGFFEVAEEMEEKHAPLLVRTNGAAILYSSAREFLLLITGRGPWGPYYLPTTNFLGPFKAEEEKEPSASKRQSSPKKRQQKARPAK
jgi:preprotein translocase subunit SecB